MIKFCLLLFCLAEILILHIDFYINPKMKSNLNANLQCEEQPLAHRKERKTWEKTLKCLTTSLLLP